MKGHPLSQLQENLSTTEKLPVRPTSLELQSREMVERGWTGLHRHRERDRLLAQLVERDKEIAELKSLLANYRSTNLRLLTALEQLTCAGVLQ